MVRAFKMMTGTLALGAVAGLLLAPRSGKETRKYLRERSNRGLDILNEQARKLRESAEAVVEKGREFTGRQRDSVETAAEAETQAYQEEGRENLGG